MLEKSCARCRAISPLSEFHRDRTKEDGLCTVCKPCKRATAIGWNARNKARKAIQSRTWAENNPARQAEIKRTYFEKNRDAHIRKLRDWGSQRKGYYASKCAERRFRQYLATPAWTDLDEIELFYADAARLTFETGYVWHVDHIVPLRSKRVCGLHCPANLRVIPGSENQVKCNRYWPDMP